MRSVATYPVIDLGELELPELPDAMGWQPLRIDPAVYGVLGDADVRGDFIDGHPRLGGLHLRRGSHCVSLPAYT